MASVLPSFAPVVVGRNLTRARRIFPAAILCAIAPLWPVGSDAAAARAIDTSNSTLTVHAYKGGALGAFGHDHEIAAPIASGTVDLEAKRVELRVQTSALEVRDPKASGKDRGEIQKTMLGPEVLDAERSPEIVFRSTAVEPAGGAGWTVRGDLTLHGVTRPVTATVQEKDGVYTGSARVRQTDFDIRPVRIAGGAVRVKDEVRLDFVIRLTR
jgi:polyisoprenoid-binding protein YceI